MHNAWSLLLISGVCAATATGCLFVEDAGLGFGSTKTGQVTAAADSQTGESNRNAGQTATSDVSDVSDVSAVSDASVTEPDTTQVATADVVTQPGWNTLEAKVFSKPGIRVELPPQALSQPLELTMVPAKDLPSGCVGQAWHLGPDGTQFAKPVRVVIQVPDSAAITTLKMATLVDGKWQPLADTGVDSAKSEVWGETLHFSPYCALAPPTPVAPSGGCYGATPQPNGTCQCEQPFTSDLSGKASYGYCKAVLVGAFEPCAGYKVFETFGPCCVNYFESIGGPSATGHGYAMPDKCAVSSADCKVALADPWGWLIQCGALP